MKAKDKSRILKTDGEEFCVNDFSQTDETS